MKPSEESAQDCLTELQRLALEAYPNVVARAAAEGRPAVAAGDRAQERTRRVRESFINGMPIKLKRFLMTQPDETPIEELCAKTSCRMIVDRLYPEDDDTAFNEHQNCSTKDLLTRIHELSKAQDVLKQGTGKLSTELQELTKILQPTINQLTTAQTSDMNNNRNNNIYNKNEQQNWNKNNAPRGNNPHQWRNNQQNWKNNNNNEQNWRPSNPNWQNQKPNWNQQRNNNTAQSSQKYCNYCIKFGHILSQCWFRPQQHQPPALPYTQYSAPNFRTSQLQNP